ncbi:sugar phosphate isomerase/epimerase family protein [Streptomyces zaehneri]|uniref:sugar phosphate isomerase/epimerase family protein n=1 Tax=Streptomyces zaehneri TaxID=3051180 RepID=UPI0028D4276D|nr:sugar phosphate isomerase/epimerase [Streptomyces sp. DSM 40713]
MQNDIRIATFGIRHELGPLSLGFRSPDGEFVRQQVVDSPRSLPLGDLPQRLRSAFGVTAVEIMDEHLSGAPAEERAALRSAVDRGELTYSLAAISRYVGDADAGRRAEDLAAVERIIKQSAEAGAQSARVILLPPPIVPQVPLAATDELVAALRHLVGVAHAAGVSLLIENDDEMTSVPEYVEALLDGVGPELGFVLDTGNLEPVMSEVVGSVTAGREPGDVQDAEQTYRAIEALLPRAQVVHVKTYGFHDDKRSKVYDLDRVLQIIADSGFAGPLTIEYGGPDSSVAYDTIRQTVARIRATTPSAQSKQVQSR